MANRYKSALVFAFSAAWISTVWGAEGPLIQESAKEMAQMCHADMLKNNPKADSKISRAYCDCVFREAMAEATDADVGALMLDKETPHFQAVVQKSVNYCQEKHILSAARAQLRNAKYEDLPDFGNSDVVRTKSGVFAAKPSGKATVLLDNDQTYTLNYGDYFCGWSAAPMGKQTVREAISGIKTVGSSMAQMMLRNPQAKMTSFDEVTVRGRPAAMLEFTEGEGQPTYKKAVITAVIDPANQAIITGVCMANIAQFDANVGKLRQLTTAALSARRYKN